MPTASSTRSSLGWSVGSAEQTAEGSATMPDLKVAIQLPALLADRITADATKTGRGVEDHVVAVLFQQALRDDADRRAAWLAEHPDAAADEEHAADLDEIEREIAYRVEGNLPLHDVEHRAEDLHQEHQRARQPGYLDPSNAAIPMTATRHIAILRATMRTEHEQRITELQEYAAAAGARGDDDARARYETRAQQLRRVCLP
jgi:hypothetical protein